MSQREGPMKRIMLAAAAALLLSVGAATAV